MEAQSTAGYFLSPQQNHLWLLQQRLAGNYLTQAALLLEGELDELRLQEAFRAATSRNEILRTVFRRQAGMKTPFQVISDVSDPGWEVRPVLNPTGDFEEAATLLKSQAARSFDLEHGPLLRVLLAKISGNKSILAVTIPTLCADRSSLISLIGEIFSHYTGCVDKLAEEPLRYIQFAQWQSELLESEEDAAIEGKTFWAERSESGEQAIALPFETAPEAAAREDLVVATIPSELAVEIEQLAAKSVASASDVLLAAWQSLLSRLTGRLRLAVGVVMPGREYEELVDAVGLIEKLLPIHVRLEGNVRFAEVLGQTQTAIAEAVGHQEYLDPSKAFASDLAIGFSYNTVPEPQQAGSLRYRILCERSSNGACKLNLKCVENQGSLNLAFHYDASRYERTSIERLSQHFMTLLAAAVSNPDQQVARLPLLTDTERNQVLDDWNQTDASYPQQTMHALIEQQAERTPDRLAVRCADRSITYAQLNQRANQLAHYLRKQGVEAGSLVGLCVDRSTEMMVAVLAIFKAGGAYVSLSSDYPKPRLTQQLEGVRLLITEEKLFGHMPDTFGSRPAGPVLRLDSDSSLWASEPQTNPDSPVTIEHLAYVIYTSGSTGTPKGVGVRHRNLVNYSWAIAQQLKLAEHPEGLQFATVSTLGADLGNTCIYPSLLSGGGLHIIPYDVATDARQMALYQARYPIDVLKIVPSHLAAILYSAEAGKVLPRKYLIAGGEVLTRNLIEKIESSGAGCQIINHYGPTEATVGSLIQPLSGYDWKLSRAASMPIGRPIANTQVYVLDSYLEPVPEGVAGELYISGAGVSAGYLGQPERTAERFLPNPFLSDATMYRTGDLVRYVPGEAGAIEFLGRTDDQVKVRGFRIELGEIEAALLRQPKVKQVVVLAREEQDRIEKRLVAYVVIAPTDQIIAEYLRQQLKEQLPDYMVPSAVILLEKLPLTPNGKIDRVALPGPDEIAAPKLHIEPSTATEHTVAQIWIEVLQRKQVSADDNFFELGGHSLMATQVVSRIRERFSVEVALRTLFESPVLRTFAEAIDLKKAQPVITDGPIRRVSREAYRTAVSNGGGRESKPDCSD
jgi:amino acid adenylation domain-containing protein